MTENIIKDGNKHCMKCLSLIKNNIMVKSCDNKIFCCEECRSDWYKEMSKEYKCNYNEWKGW